MSSAPPHPLTPCNTARAVQLSVTGAVASWCGASGHRRMAATAVRAADCPEPGPDFRGLRGRRRCWPGNSRGQSAERPDARVRR
jgi:hypothetical protein